jgi:hypothetical protein
MGVAKRFKRWRAARGETFSDPTALRSTRVHLDAAEYELKCILRDVTRVCMAEPEGFSRQPPLTNWRSGELES